MRCCEGILRSVRIQVRLVDAIDFYASKFAEFLASFLASFTLSFWRSCLPTSENSPVLIPPSRAINSLAHTPNPKRFPSLRSYLGAQRLRRPALGSQVCLQPRLNLSGTSSTALSFKCVDSSATFAY